MAIFKGEDALTAETVDRVVRSRVLDDFPQSWHGQGNLVDNAMLTWRAIYALSVLLDPLSTPAQKAAAQTIVNNFVMVYQRVAGLVKDAEDFKAAQGLN